jgi:release factor glutamine methyltransferase
LLVHSLRPHDNDDITDNDDTATALTKKTIMDQLSQQLHPNKSTIQEVLHVSLQILSEGSNNNTNNSIIIIHEPTESVLHLLSHALELSWEDNGFCQLREVLLLPPTPPQSPPYSSSSIHNLATQTITIKQYTNYLSYIHRRLHHEPIQYILEKWDFYNLIGLKVTKPILCPRPETEELVELVLDDIDRLIHDMNIGHEEKIIERKSSRRRIRVLDVGCGTGAIGVAIAYAYPQYVQVVAIDISSKAIKLSNENANYFLSSMRRANEKEQEDDGGDWCLYNAIQCSAKDFTNNKKNEEEEASISSFGTSKLWEMDFDIIVSNPPYIPMKDMTLLTKDVINYESYNALCGGYDGLDVVRDILHRLQEWTSSPTIIADHAVVAEDTNKHSSKRTTPRYCWMEVDDTHPILLEEWLSPGSIESIQHGVEYCDRRKDCFGRDRFVKFRVL